MISRNVWSIPVCFLAITVTGNAFAAEPIQRDRFTAAEPTTAQELFGQTIRATNLRSPAEELAGFHVPDGFQVELVAAEPAITKPMNMAFDAKGQLWITQSTQYPFPAKTNEKGTDAVVVLEDKDHDGNYESTRVFADGLNIPIGLMPWGDGVLCFSIPNIYYLRDTDQDGVCDSREVLLGPFDTSRDTHGMVNSLRMGGDGWVYACHGFNNQSNVQGKDGHSIAMTSGNVFRFKPDGSRVELFTQGQVNPFGMAQDKWGFWYAADCHSKPISQLIRGGCYPSFGRLDDGLGFVPPMMEHLHGSTAISGLAHTKDSRFPQAFEDDFLSGNVMTCRINRNHLTYNGATAKANVMPDLLTSDDPWFRPVDLQFGPDGCLYIADFYNKVIGHYEVPLDHPDRDRSSGRIWRIRWVGGGDTINPADAKSSTAFKPLPTAMQAYRLNESIWTSDIDEPRLVLRQIVQVDHQADPVLYQSIVIAARDILSRMRDRDAADYDRAVTKLCSDEFVASGSRLNSFSIDSPVVRALTRIFLSLKDSRAAAGVLSLCERQAAIVDSTAAQRRVLEETILSIADVVDESNMDRFIALLYSTTKDADARADQLLRIANRQMQQRGKVLGSLLTRCQTMVGDLADQWLAESAVAAKNSGGLPLVHWYGRSTKADDRKEWPTEARELPAIKNEVRKKGLFFSSFPLGEGYTGSWSSSPFVAPSHLDFYVVGHNGLPSKESPARNYVSLVKLDGAGNVAEELFRVLPPRSDIGKWIRWDLQKHAGAILQLRVVDGDSASSYAWIGIGESSLVGLNPGPIRDRWERMVLLLALSGYPTQPEIQEKVDVLINSQNADWNSRYRVHRLRSKSKSSEIVELADFVVEQRWTDLLAILGVDTGMPPHWDWSSFDDKILLNFGDAICRRCSYQDQERLVLRLSKHRAAISLIASLCERGSLSRDALRVMPKSWWEGLSPEVKPRLEAIRPDATATSNRLAIVESKASAIANMAIDLEVGAKQFADRCAACHKLGDHGKVIGPQLEGVGARGALRLCEDILWPDRNVDEAFKMTIMILDGGESVSGLVSDRTAESLLLTDQTGKQRRILQSEIEEEKRSKLSLMPGNFDESMTDSEFASLIGYLRNAANATRK